MKKLITYFLLFAALFTGCEDVYVPDIDEVNSAIVVDARIDLSEEVNKVVLTQSKGFNEGGKSFPEINGAKVKLHDNDGNVFTLPETASGEFILNFDLDPQKAYKLEINYQGNTFESGFETVPIMPDLDTVYGIPEDKVLDVAGENNVDNFRTREGVRLYTDIAANNEVSYYRFTARKVMQYVWVEPSQYADITHYLWKSSMAGGIYNIAAPAEYSGVKDIVKHPLYFCSRTMLMEEEHFFMGWTVILYQYAISESAYNFYKDLNAQLDSDGRIFDPVYVQARNNLKCTSDSEQVILGNFEISNKTEHRYYVRFLSEKKGYKVEEVFDRSPIPWSGELVDEKPPFWTY